LSELAGVDLEKAQRILAFTKSKSNSHSAWLTFMYPRLYIARQLLRDDGVIFISIDDNEVAQLRLLLDEIFGEENFIAKLTVVMNLKGNQDNFGFADTHEYCFVFAKNKEKCHLGLFDVDDEELLKNWVEDEYGLYKEADNLRATGVNAPRDKRKNLWYPIFVSFSDNSVDFYTTQDNMPKKSDDIAVYPVNPEGEALSWYWEKNKVNCDKHNLIYKLTSNGHQFYKKQRATLGDVPTKKPKTLWYKSDYSTSTATTQLKNLLGKKLFEGSKPVPFIKDILVIGSDEHSVIVDFFAGSGTTGDAVMQLNAQDGGNRKYILVQIPEAIDPKKNKTAYDFVKNDLNTEPSIFEIIKERLIRSAQKIAKEKPDYQGDLGFQVYETMPIWDNYHFEADILTPQTRLFDETTLTDDDLTALLTTWKTYDGIPLTQSLVQLDLAGYSAYHGNARLYLMHKGFSTNNFKNLLEKMDNDPAFNATSIIIFGYHFDSKSLREITENVKAYANKKSTDIDVIVRY
jgi:adenine-specific DNA-methyltransferase